MKHCILELPKALTSIDSKAALTSSKHISRHIHICRTGCNLFETMYPLWSLDCNSLLCSKEEIIKLVNLSLYMHRMFWICTLIGLGSSIPGISCFWLSANQCGNLQSAWSICLLNIDQQSAEASVLDEELVICCIQSIPLYRTIKLRSSNGR